MAPLHNYISKAELRQKALDDTRPRVTLSFYRYHQIADPQVFRDALYVRGRELEVFGRVYVASEGINAQISVPEENLDTLREYLYSYDFMDGMRLNIAVEEGDPSFYLLKIKVKDKIVADGIDDPTFDVTDTGQYLDAASFNEVTDNPETTVVDMRNYYEYEIGRFDGALDVGAETFREQLPRVVSELENKKDKPVVMYCTGGIRCEKASAYLKHNGFKEVYHLKGGVIKYAHETKEQGLESKFRGKNFVFDGRLAEKVTDDVLSNCHQCKEPADTHTNCNNEACHVLFIQCDACSTHFDGCCSIDCKKIYQLPLEEQIELRRGKKSKSNPVFKSKRRIRPTIEEINR